MVFFKKKQAASEMLNKGLETFLASSVKKFQMLSVKMSVCWREKKKVWGRRQSQMHAHKYAVHVFLYLMHGNKRQE